MSTVSIFSNRKQIPALAMFLGLFAMWGFPSAIYANQLFVLQLAPTPFSSTMCKKTREGSYIRITAKGHRDLIIRKVPGQYVPKNPDAARQKEYVHYIRLHDLTDGRITHGAIAFDPNHAVIFQSSNTKGLSRGRFISQLPPEQKYLAEQAFNTFLRLHSIMNAAVDTCHPYPNRTTYDTSDEILKIENGKRVFRELVQSYNEAPETQKELYRHESGTSQGFVDPEAGQGTNVSYQALNPLNFYVQSQEP